MADQPLTEARRVALRHVNEQGISVPQWAAVVLACAHTLQRLEAPDEVIGVGAALARLLTPHLADGALTQILLQTATPATSSDGRVLRAQVREVCWLATHACQPGANGTTATLLAGLERLLTPGTAPADGLAVDLNRWAAAVAGLGLQRPLQPHLRAAIASQQLEVLNQARSLVDKVTLPTAGPGAVERLREGIDGCIESWLRAGQGFKDESVSEPVAAQTRAGAVQVAFTSTRLRADLEQPATSAADRLDALTWTGFGGNLVAALVVAEPGHPDSRNLIAAAKHLEAVSDPLTSGRFGPRFNDLAPGPEPTPITAAPIRVASTAPVTAEPPRPVGRGVEVTPVVLTRQIEAGLAARRDIGILARAALDGQAQACELTRTLSVGQLGWLIADGQEASAQLVASVIPAMQRAHKSMPRWLVPDSMQATAVTLLEAVQRWDPAKSRWLTYAMMTARYATIHSRRESYQVPVPVSVTGDMFSPYRSSVSQPPPEPEEALVRRLQTGENRHLLHQIRQLVPDTIPATVASVLLAYHGLDGQPARDFGVIAQEQAVTRQTARRRYRAGIQILRQLLPEPVHTSYQPRPEHHPPARRPGSGRSR